MKKGRPRLGEERLAANMTIRLEHSLREELQKRADAAGRTLSQEMVFRLRHSLHWNFEVQVVLNAKPNASDS